MRVLALAYKQAEPAAASWAREQVEEGLQFAGFVAFACKVSLDHK
jgi:magnesium-transporting ATPase (P-type)